LTDSVELFFGGGGGWNNKFGSAGLGLSELFPSGGSKRKNSAAAAIAAMAAVFGASFIGYRVCAEDGI